MMHLVDVQNVSKSYQSKIAVNNLSFTLKSGQVLGLLGHNGAGKSSLINALLGANNYQGNISVCGLNPVNQRAPLMQHLAYISDVDVLPKWMTVKQILRYTNGVHPSFDLAKAKQLLTKTDIQQGSKISTLSKGMKVQLHLALTIATDTKVLILDEPTLGLDLIYRDTFYRHLIEWMQDGERTLIIASHEVNEIEHLLTDVLILKQGNSICQGAIEDVLQRYIMVEATHEFTEQLQVLKPLSSEPGLGCNKWLISSEYRDQVSEFGKISTPSLQALFIALQKESR
ncbi:ABC transporter ATP-binding protein [Psychromonas sp. Urea-02u-13]|uniref:ABC transporter ATP-binding protein n=1 Tax=Psychromonas sp. Urea-02u-13 TaxID=2058326 RepID=UPI000C32A4E8|nr:ABC transporter ATP-binding protein [Psychromonas sp. Urea-02u-13]PKG39978.1 ABC transporter ATP-binding protein [Psychromonas sp. Urea-02u-13]